MRIYFDTPTLERITKYQAAKFLYMLSAIGGTMGLLTGFSLISSVEILYRELARVREFLMGEGDGVASVIMLTFTKRPGPHADFYKEARPPC